MAQIAYSTRIHGLVTIGLVREGRPDSARDAEGDRRSDDGPRCRWQAASRWV